MMSLDIGLAQVRKKTQYKKFPDKRSMKRRDGEVLVFVNIIRAREGVPSVL